MASGINNWGLNAQALQNKVGNAVTGSYGTDNTALGASELDSIASPSVRHQRMVSNMGRDEFSRAHPDAGVSAHQGDLAKMRQMQQQLGQKR